MKMIYSTLTMIAVMTLFSAPANATEEPSFRSVLKSGEFELRDYPALVVAEVTVAGAQNEAASRGFRILAGYIFGGNQRRQASNTRAAAPQGPSSEKIAMTAPVTQVPNGGKWIVRFTMPKGYTLGSLPTPNDKRVQLRQVPPSRFAVLQFSGLARPDAVSAKSAELLAAAKAHHLKPVGAVALAQYNPPWTLWFMRRNEVMIAVN